MRTRIRIAVALAIAVLVLIVAGVAAAGGGDPAPPKAPVAQPVSNAPCGKDVGLGSGPDTAVSYTPCPGDDPIDLVGHAQTVVPTPGMDDVRPTGWIKAEPNADGTSVAVRFWSGVEPCYVLDHVDVAYGIDAVTITLYQGSDPTAGDVACIDIAMLKQVVVPLDQPLDGRQLLDGTRA